MRGGVPIVSYLFLRKTLADRQITLPAGYMGSGLIGAALISCVSFPSFSVFYPESIVIDS
jgi:hypothetical protein